MKRRLFLVSAAGFALTGCALLQPRQAPVPVVRDGFIVRETPVPSEDMTAFLPEGDTVYMTGSINADTVAGFAAVREANPEANRLVILQASGTQGSAETIAFGRAVREAGFTTHLRNDSVVTGGAVDAFMGGTQRTMEDGAVIAVARPEDADALKGYSTEMVGGDGFGRFAEEFGGRRRPRTMTIAEIGAMGITSANVGNVLAVEG